MRETVFTLWNLTPIRLAIRLANTGLNLVTTRELITALSRADLFLTLIAIAWLIPWEKVALLAYRLIRHRRAHRRPRAASSFATLPVLVHLLPPAWPGLVVAVRQGDPIVARSCVDPTWPRGASLITSRPGDQQELPERRPQPR